MYEASFIHESGGIKTDMNILIVDDEIQICRWFDILIRKTGLSVHIKGTCSNGQEALQFCRNHRVDLVLTDIRMPVMDGLALIKHLKSEFPAIRTLILSAYGEFGFASEALKSGASDYILKAEVTVDSLKDTIQKIQSDLEMELKRNQEVHMIKSKLNQNQYELRSLYFRRLLEGNSFTATQLQTERELLRISLFDKHVILLAVSLDDYPHVLQTGKIRSKELLNLAVINIIDETLLYEAGSGCSFLYEENLFIGLFNTRVAGNKSIRESTFHYVHRIFNHLRDYLGVSASIGISMSYRDLSQIGKQFEEAKAALQEKRFYGKRVIAWFEEMIPSGKQTDIFLNTSPCQSAIERRDYTGLRGCINDSLMTMEMNQSQSAKEVKSQALELVYYMVQQLRRNYSQERVGPSMLDPGAPHEEIRELDTFQDVREWLMEKIEHLLMQSASVHQRYSEPVMKSMQLIHEAYADDISLALVAEQVHLNKTYLSELFKKEVGTSFNDYLTQIRIDKAKQLILSGKRMSALAVQVGYPNASYFTKVFKKVTGMTPVEFKHVSEI